MRRAPGASLRILNLYQELEHETPAVGLKRLVRLVADGKLIPHLGVEADWREIGPVAQALIERRFQGKAVLQISARNLTGGIGETLCSRPGIVFLDTAFRPVRPAAGVGLTRRT